MKKVLFSIVMVPFILSAQQPQVESEQPVNPDKALYSLGVALSQNLVGYNFNQNEADKIISGFSDSLKNSIKKENYDLSTISPYINKRQQENAKMEKDKGKDYVSKAIKEKGAEKSKSGLVYIPISRGKGANPKPEDEVKVHYRGYLIDGKEFDSSYKRGEPAKFPLSAVIPCWTEGVQKMKVGGKAKLICPSDIAYGDMGRPPLIPGGATLIFEVELLDIVKKQEKKETIPAESKNVDKNNATKGQTQDKK